jgi:hypothetical protein
MTRTVSLLTDFTEDEYLLLTELLCERRVRAETSRGFTAADDLLNKIVYAAKVTKVQVAA